MFRCQSCGEFFPLIQVELWERREISDLYCRKCYAEHALTDSLVNVLAFADIAD